MLAKIKILKYSIRKFFLVIVSLSLGSNIFAQNDTISHFYRDSTGQLFIAHGTHVYLFMGTSNDASKSIKLKGINNEDSPIHWSGHGPKHLTHLNVYLGRRVSFDLFSDAIPPQTNINFDSGKGFKKDNTIYLSGGCTIELSATDKDAGLKGIFYSLNEGANIKYFEPIVLKSEGEYKLNVFALDNVGNKEEEISKSIVVDNTPPLTQFSIDGDSYNDVVSGRSKFILTSVDALGVNQTLFSIDSGKVFPYTKPIQAATLTEGEHTISWYSVDVVDNTETKKTSTFFVDKTPPMVFEEVIGNTYMVAGKEYSSGRSQLKIAAVDNKAGIKEINYSLNNSEYKKYEKPVYLSDILGTVSVKSFALDNVNNRSQSDTQSETFSMPTVDITGPQIFYGFSGAKITLRDTTWIGPKTKIIISSKDIGAGVNKMTYKMKGGEEQVYTAPFVVESEGYHEFGCTAYDNVDNVNLISFGFGVDSKAPSIFYHFSIDPIKWVIDNGEKIPVYTKGVKLYLAATDNLSGIDKLTYANDQEKETLYKTPIESLKSGKTYSMQIKAIDLLGNQSEVVVKFRIE